MTIKTVTSEDARIKMRDILDDVHTGAEVIIERYRRPAAVVVNYAEWQAWKASQKAQLIAEAKQNLAKAKADPKSLTGHEELMQLMIEKRTQGPAAHVAA